MTRPSIISMLLGVYLSLICLAPNAFCQLTVLSSGNIKVQWRGTQLDLIRSQLADVEVKGPLRSELESQLSWLSAWKPGSLTDTATWEQKSSGSLLTEPTVDPSGLASPLRERLLGKQAKPTAQDTSRLQAALVQHDQDIGLRQLHLHWLDQKQYRQKYLSEIIDAADQLAGMLDQVNPQTDDSRLARAFCYYRLCRALIYRESPEATAEKPIQDIASHESRLLAAYTQMIELSGKERPEFILVEVRMLRRDNWLGQALVKLEGHAATVEKQWYLKKRRDLLKELGWSAPAQEAEKVYAAAFPEAVAKERS
jgi:hypothetical protein